MKPLRRLYQPLIDHEVIYYPVCIHDKINAHINGVWPTPKYILINAYWMQFHISRRVKEYLT
jgi:hypothetical protein